MSEIKKIKPALSKGTRDFLPVEVAKRNYIFETIKSVFKKYGFEEIETPAIERMETLTGKYGEEGDKLLFKILNSGDFLKDVPKDDLAAANSQATIKYIAEKGLRYDLTVPLARYVVQHQENLAFPFKRFHIGPVWRADRPQKGRYQEFYQCDADVIGSTSLLNEVELTMIYAEVFGSLGIEATIHFSNRKFLLGLAEYCLALDNFQAFVTILDKQDKVERSEIITQLNSLGANRSGDKYQEICDVLDETNEYFAITGFLREKFVQIKSDMGLLGLDEIDWIFKSYWKNYELFKVKAQFTFYLARGLNYYSGTIWEVMLNWNAPANINITMGSLGGGGRYDNLTEIFGAKNMSGVGISFGIERIYDVMEELNLFPPTISQGVKVLFVPREEEMEEFAFELANVLRSDGIAAEVYLGNVKKQKHFKYIEDKHIAYFVEVGGDERSTGKFRLRNVQTRDTQSNLTIADIASKVK